MIQTFSFLGIYSRGSIFSNLAGRGGGDVGGKEAAVVGLICIFIVMVVVAQLSEYITIIRP